MRQQNAICCLNDDDRESAGGVHRSASPWRLHSRTGCRCGPFRWLRSPQTAFCILRQKWLEIKRLVDEMMIIIILSHNVSLYGLVFSFREWFFQPHDAIFFGLLGALSQDPHPGSAADPAGGLPCSGLTIREVSVWARPFNDTRVVFLPLIHDAELDLPAIAKFLIAVAASF